MNLPNEKIAEIAAYAIDWCKECESVHTKAGRDLMAEEFAASRKEYEVILDTALDNLDNGEA
jgi:hypothetical protein